MVVQVLDFVIGLFPSLLGTLDQMMITNDVSVLQIIFAFLIMTLLIYAFIPRP